AAGLYRNKPVIDLSQRVYGRAVAGELRVEDFGRPLQTHGENLCLRGHNCECREGTQNRRLLHNASFQMLLWRRPPDRIARRYFMIVKWLLFRTLFQKLIDPPPLNGSTLKYGFDHEGGPQWQTSDTSPTRSSRSFGRLRFCAAKAWRWRMPF